MSTKLWILSALRSWDGNICERVWHGSQFTWSALLGEGENSSGEGDGLAVRTFSREFSQSGISHFRLSIEYDCIRWRHISANIYRNNLEFPSDSSLIFYPQITLELLPTTLAIPIPSLPLHRTWPGSAPAQLTSGGSLKAGVARCECTVESVAHFCAHIARWGREMMGDRRRLLSLSRTRGKNFKKIRGKRPLVGCSRVMDLLISFGANGPL